MPRANCNGGTLRSGVTNARTSAQAALTSPRSRDGAWKTARHAVERVCTGGEHRCTFAFWRRAGLSIALLTSPCFAEVEAAAPKPAQPFEPVELRWVRLEGAEQCPPRASFEAALQKRLGKASFNARGSRILTVTLSNEKGPFRVVLSLRARASEEVESKQELFSYSSECDEVFSATVLSVALLLNPDEMEDPSEEGPLVDSRFFDPPEGSGALAVPATERSPSDPTEASPDEKPTFEIPVAPRPWARQHGAVAGAFALGIEQLPTPAMGFSARTEWPIARSWLLWLAADWLQAAPGAEAGVGVTVTQGSGWVGGAWVPYESDLFEFHLLGGLGVRQLTATLTGSDPRYHLALQLGVGLVLEVTDQFALDTRATAVVPLRSELIGPSWTQPAIGGQLQIGAIVGIPNPPAPN